MNMKITFFWDVILCSVKHTDVLKEPVTFIIRVKE
jgi:hypothetical protein